MRRLLILEDGSAYEGEAFGSDKFQIGELIFQTGMCGYQETLSDPSYYGQIITMTYPVIGNVGINRDDFESMNPQLFGLVVKEYDDYYSNFRGKMSLDEYMKLKEIPGISGVDTRAITKKIRDNGVMKATLADEDEDVEKVVAALRNTSKVTNGVKYVSTTKSYTIPNGEYKIVLLDLGVKYGLIRELNKRGCSIVVMPYNATKEEILSVDPDGVVVSSGPGRSRYVSSVVETVKNIARKVAVMGIGLGCQIICEAFGGNIEEAKFGFHGNSCPVIKLESGKVEFTSQNSRYYVEEQSLENTPLKATYKNLNDGSIQGVRHEELPVIGVQFTAEASPGADDAKYIFDEFVEMMGGVR